MFELSKGINLSHWLSQVFGWSPKEQFITKDDIARIANLGFDHVRLPIDEEEMWHIDGRKNTESFTLLHSCINWCLEYQLRVVVDLHILRSHHFNAGNNEGAMTLWDTPEHQDNMIVLWQQLSEELKQYPNDAVAYEFMNEPVAPKHSLWNTLIARGHKAIRSLEPERTLIFGPNKWQFPQFFKYLEIPKHDPHIILSFHTYDPLPLTHYKAYWMPLGNYSGSVQYPGRIIPNEHFSEFEQATKGDKVLQIVKEHNVFTADSFNRIFEPAIAFAKKAGLSLYCNEFGCLPSVPKDARKQYFTDITSAFKKHNIAYASWDYKGDFGIVHWDRNNYTNGAEDKDIIQILSQNS